MTLKIKCSKPNNNNSQRTCGRQIIRFEEKVEEIDTSNEMMNQNIRLRHNIIYCLKGGKTEKLLYKTVQMFLKKGRKKERKEERKNERKKTRNRTTIQTTLFSHFHR